jgi:type IV secretory pathway TrbL component
VYWYVLALAVLSVIIGGARMAWEQRAQPGKDLVRSLLTLLVVTGFGLAVIGLCVTAADEFSSWIIERSLRDQGGTSFKDAVSAMLGLDTLTGDAISAIAVIVLGLIAFIACLLQVVAMVVRGAMLILLAGILPLAAAATNTEMGMSWFKKCVAWLVAFILYKPAAAIIYATAFRMIGSNTDEESNGLVTAVSGLGLMVMAIVALPALMRFVTPMVGAMAGGAAGGSVAALAAVPAMGAVSTSSRGAASGSQGAPSTAGASGSGTSGSSGVGGSSSAAGSSGSTGRPGSTGAAGQTSGGQAPSPAGAGAASSGAASSNGAVPAASSTSGGSAAAAGAAAGPAGVAAGAAAQATRQVAQRGAEAAIETAQGAASEGETK